MDIPDRKYTRPLSFGQLDALLEQLEREAREARGEPPPQRIRRTLYLEKDLWYKLDVVAPICGYRGAKHLLECLAKEFLRSYEAQEGALPSRPPDRR